MIWLRVIRFLSDFSGAPPGGFSLAWEKLGGHFFGHGLADWMATISFGFPLQTKGSVADVDGIKPHWNTRPSNPGRHEWSLRWSFSPTVLYHVKTSRSEKYILCVEVSSRKSQESVKRVQFMRILCNDSKVVCCVPWLYFKDRHGKAQRNACVSNSSRFLYFCTRHFEALRT